jgi:hypothetical protein
MAPANGNDYQVDNASINPSAAARNAEQTLGVPREKTGFTA